jgi:hypothetical protein
MPKIALLLENRPVAAPAPSCRQRDASRSNSIRFIPWSESNQPSPGLNSMAIAFSAAKRVKPTVQLHLDEVEAFHQEKLAVTRRSVKGACR